MRTPQRIATLAATAFATLGLAGPASAVAAPVLDLQSSHVPAASVPAGTYAKYTLSVANDGDAETSGNVSVELAVPAGFEVTEVSVNMTEFFGFEFVPWVCSTAPDSRSATCTGPEVEGFGPFPIEADKEACAEPFLGFVSLDCRIFVTVKADKDVSPGEVHPTIEACGGGAAACATEDDPLEVDLFGFGLTGFDGEVLRESGEPATQAGSHPSTAAVDFSLGTYLNRDGNLSVPEQIKDALVQIPPGLVGNPQVVPFCTQEQLQVTGSTGTSLCPPESQVGEVRIYTPENITGPVSAEGVFRMETPFGVPGLFAFNYLGARVQLYADLRSDGDYGITVINKNAPQSIQVGRVAFTFWGVPADPAHDPERKCPAGTTDGEGNSKAKGCSSEADPRAFISLPTSCAGPGPNNSVETLLEAFGWDGGSDSDSFLSHSPGEPENLIGADGCNAVPFEPTIQARPTTNRADSPSGFDVALHIPQNDDPEGIATAHLRDTTVTLPEGLVVNPASANGLDGCSESQVKLKAEGKGNCPKASRLADVAVHSPLVDHPLNGSAYLADPFDNPFDSLLALYLVVDDPETGVTVKLAGEVELDSDTGQVSATFKQNPQLPFEDFELEFFGGAGGALRTPALCDEYTTESEMTPWTAPEGQTVQDADTWAIQQGCADDEGQLPHAPSLDAGTVSPIAGAESPFVVHLRREDGTQELSKVTLSPPPGLLAKLAGTSLCPEASLAAAEDKDGKAEERSPSCPATSRVGSVVAGAGAGPQPYYAKGTAYLAGPYKGAPISIAVITPATAGPFDLGTIVTRIAAYVDPSTARITAVADPLPEIIEGIPLDVRTVDVALDRPQFTRNPTSCDPLSVDSLITSTLGALAPLSSRFQVGECGRLGFKPKVALRLFGKRFTRGSNPRLRAIVMPREDDANIAHTSVTMPRSLFLDQSHIRTICTRVQFAQGACPAGSVYGHATATSPLVDYPITGNVYLRSSSNKLPDLVADLRGPAHQPVRVEVVGRTDSVKGALRNTFDVVPDAPVSKFTLDLQAGRKSLLVASRNLCKGPQRPKIEMTAQNGKQLTLTPKIKIPCKKQRGGKGKQGRR